MPTTMMPTATATPTIAMNDLRRFRWTIWLPWCLIEARKTADPAAALATMQARFHSRFTAMRNAGIANESIKRAEIDDPRIPEDAWQFAFQGIVERRRSRMGRVKGQHLPRYQKKETRNAHQ